MTASPLLPPYDGALLTTLPALAVLDVAGADAAAFLHGQLSSDVQALAPGEAQYASFNSPKGRMLATLVVARDQAGDGYRLLLAADLVETIRKRLAMFVLRSKVTLVDATAALARLGVGGAGATEAVSAVFGPAPGAFSYREVEGVSVLALPDGRFIVLAPMAHADRARFALAERTTPVDASAWEWLAIHAGVPSVTAATSDQFVAQMANWELVGGVNFQKGCYPGQEIVARMQYLGRLKERLHAFHVATAPPMAGTKLFALSFGNQPCGMVVNSAPAPSGGSDLLAVAQNAAVTAADLRLGAPDGPALQVLVLPYAIPAPSAPPGRVA